MRLFARKAFDGQRFLTNVLVEIDDSRITLVRPNSPEPSNADAVRVGALLPGLIDAHTHLIWDATFDSASQVEREGGPRTLLRALHHAQQHLQAGVTTVRDMGSTGGLSVLASEATATGTVMGPRIVAAGRALGAPGGHASALCRAVTDARDAARAASEELDNGARVIKLMASGGLHEPGDEPERLALDPDVIAAVIDVARAANIPVAAHAHHPQVIKALVSAGVTSIEHGALLDRPTARMMAERGAVLVPTLTIFARVAAIQGLDPGTQGLYQQIDRSAQAACRLAADEGVQIVAGTDSGGPETPHGSIALELQLLNDAGLSIEQALSAATTSASELLGVQDETGRLAPGLSADLVGVDERVTADLGALSSVDWVMHRGRLVERSAQVPRPTGWA